MASIALEVARSLREYAFWLEREMAQSHRIKAYRRAAGVAAHLSVEEAAGLRSAEHWQTLSSFGPSTAAFAATVATGEVPPKLLEARARNAQPLDPAGAGLGGRRTPSADDLA